MRKIATEAELWLRQAGPFIRTHGLGEGDCVGLCTDAAGALVIDVSTLPYPGAFLAFPARW